ncbi:hypothetical protein LINGRAHAP2_LOCUS7892 [Linum grandiflorum]
MIARAELFGDDHAGKMFLFCLLSSTLFVDKTPDWTQMQVYEYVRVTKEIRMYTWGTSALTWLYKQLGTTTRAYIKGYCECLYLLQSWIHEYFPRT